MRNSAFHTVCSKAGMVVLLVSVITLHTCGDDNSSTGSSIGNGRFIDSPVAGLAFASGDQSGLTDSDGGFTYKTGQTIRFSIGDIIVGQSTPRSLMTPVSLVTGASDESDPMATNIARFLQTLDDDADLQNGITIAQVVREQAAGLSVDFDQSMEGFSNNTAVLETVRELTSVTSAGERSLVSISMAQNHLRTTLLARFVGTYNGVYSGDDAGTWVVMVDSAGTISGDGVGSDEVFTIIGSVSSSGTAYFVAGDVTTGATFTGTITESGEVSGTWVNEYWNMSGTFSGKKTSSQ